MAAEVQADSQNRADLGEGRTCLCELRAKSSLPACVFTPPPLPPPQWNALVLETGAGGRFVGGTHAHLAGRSVLTHQNHSMTFDRRKPMLSCRNTCRRWASRCMRLWRVAARLTLTLAGCQTQGLPRRSLQGTPLCCNYVAQPV